MVTARLRLVIAVLFALTLVGCEYKVQQYMITDVQSRREYASTGFPTVVGGGAITFYDDLSKKGVTLQSYEMTDKEGKTYTIVNDWWTGKPKIVSVDVKK